MLGDRLKLASSPLLADGIVLEMIESRALAGSGMVLSTLTSSPLLSSSWRDYGRSTSGCSVSPRA
jgi:hypothetical protein